MSAFIRRNGSYREARASQGNLVYNQTEHCSNRVRLSNLVFDGKVYLLANKSDSIQAVVDFLQNSRVSRFVLRWSTSLCSDSLIESNGKHLRDVFSP